MCQAEEAHLASIHSQEENKCVQKLNMNDKFWFGANDEETEGHFAWTDKSAWEFTH